MDEPANKNQPVTRSYLALRDIEAMVNHIKRTRNVQKVTLIGWSWGAMMGGYYASLHSENVQIGPGSALQNKRRPTEFNFALGAYRVASEAANTGRWNGEIPVENKDEYRDPALPRRSGTNAWPLTQRATAERHQACGLQMESWRIRSIRRQVAPCGTPPTYMHLRS